MKIKTIMLNTESYIKKKKEEARLHILNTLQHMCDYNCTETNMHIRDEIMKSVGGIIEEISQERHELKEALRVTHNHIYTLYHTPNSVKKELKSHMLKAFFKSGDTLFQKSKYIINKHWPPKS